MTIDSFHREPLPPAPIMDAESVQEVPPSPLPEVPIPRTGSIIAALIQGYATVKIREDAKIVLVTKVLNDGIGDYFHLLGVVKILLAAEARYTITALLSIGKKWPDLLTRHPPPSSDRFKLIQLETATEDSHPMRFSKSKMAIINSADAVIGVSYGLVTPKPEKPVDYLTEINLHIENHPRYPFLPRQWSMGFGEGYSFYQDPFASRLASLPRDEAARIAIEALSPETRHLLKLASDEPPLTVYPARKTLHTGYFAKNDYLLQRFLFILAEATKTNTTDMEIISKKLDPQLFFTCYIKPFEEVFRSCGITTFEFVEKDGSSNTFAFSGEQKRTVRILQLIPLPHDELTALRFFSQEPDGCTGDNSLQECLTLEKLPFYENIKRENLEMLKACVQEKFPKFQELWLYYNLLSQLLNTPRNRNPISIELVECLRFLARILNRPRLYEQQKIFAKTVKKLSDLPKQVNAILARNFTIRAKPELKKLESEAIKDFHHGNSASLIDYFKKLTGDA